MEELEDVRIISKQTSPGSTSIKWSKEHQAYFSRNNSETTDVVMIQDAEELKPYYREDYDYYFDDWNEDIDSCGIFPQQATDAVYITRDREKGADQSEPVEPGFYRLTNINHEWALEPVSNIHQDKYIDLDVGVSELWDDVERFFENKGVFEKYNMVKRRSSLLYGPPGTGKSFSAIHVCKRVIEEYNAVVILTPPKDTVFKDLTSSFREPLSDYNNMFIMEEMTEAQNKKEEILSFLDGEDSWNNSYAIGTTNYPGKLDKNVVDRPGRFDKVIEVDTPSFDMRREYLESVSDRDFTDDEISMTDGYSFSYLKELVLRMELEDKSLETVVNEFESLKDEIDNAFKDSERVGVV